MTKEVFIYGKAGYTSAAREDFASKMLPVRYVDVKQDKEALKRMLELTGGRRNVPVIVEDGKVTVGWGGT